MKEYQVITQKDKWFSGRFDADQLQNLLNQRGREGWRVVSMVSASREGFVTGGDKDELIILLEKDLPSASQIAAHETALKNAAQKSFGFKAASKPAPKPTHNGDEPDIYQL